MQLIESLGVRAGLVLNPATPLHCLDKVIDRLDLILLMSVNPGFGGQNFVESALPKIEAVRKRIEASSRDIWLEVDGGVKADNAERICSAGADTLVAGSASFNGRRVRYSGLGCHRSAPQVADQLTGSRKKGIGQFLCS